MTITKKTVTSFSPIVDSSGEISLEPQQPPKQMLLQLRSKWREVKWIVFLLVLTLLLSLVVYYLASLVQPLPLPLPQISSFPAFVPPLVAANNTDTLKAEERRHLARILKEASMEEEEKTVIVTMMNQAYAEQNSKFHVFLKGFRLGERTERLLRHVVVVCLDEKAYSRCVEVYPRRCFLLRTNGIDFFRERTEFLGSLLKLGYNFLFTVHT